MWNTAALKRIGLKTGKGSQAIQILPGIRTYPVTVFNPLDFDTKELTISNDTISIHHYSASWNCAHQKKIRKLKKMIPNFILKRKSLYLSKKSVLFVDKILDREENF